MGRTKAYEIVLSDFTGNNITNPFYTTKLRTLVAITDFNVFSNDGSGTLLTPSSGGYTFNTGTGIIDMISGVGTGNYVLEIYTE